MHIFLYVSILFILLYLLMNAVLAIGNIFIKSKQFLGCAFLFIISLCIVGYYTEPAVEDDLYRFFNEIRVYKQMGFFYALSEGTWSSTPLSTILLYCVSITNDVHLLPVITIIVYMGTFIYIYYDSRDSEKVNIRNYFFALVFLISSRDLYASITGFRFPIAIAIGMLAIYFDFYKSKQKKIISYILYVCALLFHLSLIVLLLLRVLYQVKIFRTKHWLLALLVFATFTTIVGFLKSLSNTGTFFINQLWQIGVKAENYQATVGASNSIKLMSGYLLMTLAVFLDIRLSITPENKFYCIKDLRRTNELIIFTQMGIVFCASLFIFVNEVLFRYICLFVSVSATISRRTYRSFKTHYFIVLLYGCATIILQIYSIMNNYLRWDFW